MTANAWRPSLPACVEPPAASRRMDSRGGDPGRKSPGVLRASRCPDGRGRSPTAAPAARRMPRPPARDVGELPPPQRLVQAAGAVVPQSVRHGGGDARQVVGEPLKTSSRRVVVRVEDLERSRRRHPSSCASRSRSASRSGSGPGVRLVLLGGHDVGVRAEPAPAEQQLAHLEQQQRDRATGSSLRAISRIASRKLSTWSAIDWPRSSSSLSSAHRPRRRS